jgi:hypothetical protein
LSKKPGSWLSLPFDLWRAGFEAQQVIALRLAKLALGGPAATTEMNRMVSEKMTAAVEAQSAAAAAMMTGDAAEIPSRTVALYRRKMRANRNRLSAASAGSAPRRRRSKKHTPT